ncbi:MAG: hypothetical protein L7U72_00620 [Rubripirellula sp.]|nr:hypothetical protein [Rubripirellula sp.]
MQNAEEILDGTFLEVRAKLLEVAATLDRIERAQGDSGDFNHQSTQRRKKLDQAVEILLSSGNDRAERLQKLFSREYEDAWRDDFGI